MPSLTKEDKDTKDIDWLALSDDEILSMPVPDFNSVADDADSASDAKEDTADLEDKESSEITDSGDSDDDDDDEETVDDDTAAEDDKADESADKDEDKDASETGKEEETEVSDTPAAEKPDSEDAVKAKKSSEEAKSKEKDNQTAGETPAIDYEKEYKRLIAPFKANGRDIQVTSVDDAIALMQMGANYNKKMAALKPNLRLLKLLEQNELLDESKLSFLIDLDKKKPDAINKLVKDSGIDPMEFDADKANGYKQSTYTVDEREIELDGVLEELQDTPSYRKTLDIVGNKWDAASKQTVAGAPQLLKVINDHVSSGIYDLISAEMDRERMFGRLQGLSDIEAYRQVGDSLHAKGAFNHLVQGSSQDQGKPAAPPQVIQPKPKMVEDDKRKDKKRAASPNKPAAPTVTSEDFNPLALSDEEFSKLANQRYK